MTHSHAQYLDRRHISELDGIRAVAILLVFTAHPVYPGVWPSLHGATGVSVFFVLSGFLITTLGLRETARSGRFGLGSFYVRRLFRIYPLFFAVLALYSALVLVAGMRPEARGAFLDELPWMVLFVPEHAMFFNDSGVHIPFDGSWSIGIEEKFYLVWPLLGLVLLAGRFRSRVVALVLATAVFGAAGFLDPSQPGGWNHALQPYGLIAIGCLVGVLLHERRWYDRLSWLGRPQPMIGVGVFVLVLQFGTDLAELGRPLYVAYGAVLAAALIGAVTHSGSGTGWLRSRPMAFLGRISYAFYLTHNFALNAAEAVIPQRSFLLSLLSSAIAMVLAVGLAWVLHVTVEKPFIELGRRVVGTRRRARTLPTVGTTEVGGSGPAEPEEAPARQGDPEEVSTARS
ncbi:MAG: acyltransferase [Klenkia sp.]|nr:acyltransferase [Klenkia sp.]